MYFIEYEENKKKYSWFLKFINNILSAFKMEIYRKTVTEKEGDYEVDYYEYYLWKKE